MKIKLKQYISYGLVSPHLENPADFPKPVFIWKGSCRNTPQLIYINVGNNLRKPKSESEFIDMTEIPLLTFDKLFDLIEENQFENETDKKIAEKILEAERDWRISLESLNDFITVLEKEVGGTVSKTSLNKLLKKYNKNISQYAWESESISYLLDIFELTKETELRKIFIKLTEKVKTE